MCAIDRLFFSTSGMASGARKIVWREACGLHALRLAQIIKKKKNTHTFLRGKSPSSRVGVAKA